MKSSGILTGFILLIGLHLVGQNVLKSESDTVVLSISTAEQRFVSKNLTILINQYNIDIAKDNMLQARLWFNPNLNYGTTLYNAETHKFFSDYYPTSTFSDENVQVQQLITLAGRHHATWKLAEVGVKQAYYQLQDIVRNLKYELHTDISDLYFNQQLIKMYENEEIAIQHMLEVTKDLYAHGNAAGNEVIQLQAQLQDAIAQEIACQQSVFNDEQDLRILLCYSKNTRFKVIELQQFNTDPKQLPRLRAVMDTAIKNRPDLLLAYAGSEYAERNLTLQKASALPDLTIGTFYSGVNASAAGYTGIYGDMDLPIFNRNQWNIIAGKHSLEQAAATDTLTLITVQSEVASAYEGMLLINYHLNLIEKEYGKNYDNDLEELFSNAVKNYDKRIINILTLLSLMSTYIDGKTNLLNLQVQYFNAIKNVNLNAGIELIK